MIYLQEDEAIKLLNEKFIEVFGLGNTTSAEKLGGNETSL